MSGVIKLGILNDEGAIESQVEPVMGWGESSPVFIPGVGRRWVAYSQAVQDNEISPDHRGVEWAVGDLWLLLPGVHSQPGLSGLHSSDLRTDV